MASAKRIPSAYTMVGPIPTRVPLDSVNPVQVFFFIFGFVKCTNVLRTYSYT